MNNLTIEQMQAKFRAAFNGMNALMDPDSIKACANEFTQEEMNQFHGMKFAMNKETLNTHEWKLDALKDRLEALEALEAEQATKLAIIGIGMTLTVTALVSLVIVARSEEKADRKAAIKTQILADIVDYEQSENYPNKETEFIIKMNQKGFTKEKWMTKYINTNFGKAIF